MPATVDQNMDSIRADLTLAFVCVTDSRALVADGRPLAEVRAKVYGAIDALNRVLDDLRVIEE